MTLGNRHTETNVVRALEWATHSSDLREMTRTQKHAQYYRLSRAVWLDRRAEVDVGTLGVAHSLAVPGSVIGGWSAAALHGFSAPGRATPELIVGPSFKRRQGVTLRRTVAPPPGLLQVGRVSLIEPHFTAFELVRFEQSHLAGVLALERLGREGLDLGKLPEIQRYFNGHWGEARVRRALADVDLRAESPKETELRLLLNAAGITGFETQLRITELGYRLDLGHKRARIGVEYDGAHHRSSTQQVQDAQRRNRLQSHGWTIITVTWQQLNERPEEIIAQVKDALHAASVAG